MMISSMKKAGTESSLVVYCCVNTSICVSGDRHVSGDLANCEVSTLNALVLRTEEQVSFG